MVNNVVNINSQEVDVNLTRMIVEAQKANCKYFILIGVNDKDDIEIYYDSNIYNPKDELWLIEKAKLELVLDDYEIEE